jgi:hypothetical protein
MAYIIVHSLQIPFEKIIFLIIPLATNMLPAFVFSIRGRPQMPRFIYWPLIIYIALSILGFLQPRLDLFWTLFAVLVPAIAALIALLTTFIPKQINEVENVKPA